MNRETENVLNERGKVILKIIRRLVSSQLDADHMDYLLRDAQVIYEDAFNEVRL